MSVLHWLEDGTTLAFHCPACGKNHYIAVNARHEESTDPPCWSWNGDMDKPSFRPSIRTWANGEAVRLNHSCHSFVTDGEISFCDDSFHEFAGQTLKLPEWEESINDDAS